MGFLDRIKTKKTDAVKTDSDAADQAVAAEISVPKTKAEFAASGAWAYRVLVKPLVTEKAATQGAINKYMFVVANWAKKQHVAIAIKEMYKVSPIKVNLINVQGHRVRSGKGSGRRVDYKKAVVTLAKGDSITIHEGV